MMKLTLAILLMYAVIELLAPTNAHAFGKQKEAEEVKPTAISKPTVVIKPATVVPDVKSVPPKPLVIKPVATKPAALLRTSIKYVPKSHAEKPTKPKVAIARRETPVQTSKKAELPNSPEVAKQPTTGETVGQKVDQGIDTVSGMFNKLKTSVSSPATQKSCSSAEKAMSQC